ncbi:MAG: hypothetical protein HY909_29720 [Deltaproteobacteria bacterium]|nr:hypothetical protein [Deltaproteobacteria bacterium]
MRRWIPVLVAHLLGCGGPDAPRDAGAAPTWRDALGPTEAATDATDGAVPPPEVDLVPFLAGEFHRVYTPPDGRYLNDHTVLPGPDGRWHLLGITDESTGNPWGEESFLHATANDLLGPWTPQPDALRGEPSQGEGCCVWAPHVVRLDAGTYVMFYTTPQGGTGQRRATSPDLQGWTRVAVDRDEARRPPGGRDGFLLRDGDRWLLYSTGVSADRRGQLVVTETREDPSETTSWSRPPRVVLEDPKPNYDWGNLESPFVVPYRGRYYLFTTRTGPGPSDYTRTYVFRSRVPERFAWEPITELRGHASEVVLAGGRMFVTSGGWTSALGERNRGLLVAPLAWAPAP